MTDQGRPDRTMRIDINPADIDLGGKVKQDQPPRQVSGRWRVRSSERSTPFFKLLESVYDAVFITRLDGKILECNERACEFFQQPSTSLTGQNVVNLISGATAQLMETIQENLQDRKYMLIEARCKRGDTTSFAAEIAVNKIELDAKGQLCFFVRDVTVRQQALSDLKDANERLQAHDRARMEFVSNVSHELRTPLTSMMYGIGNMLRGVVGPIPDKVVLYLERLQSDCQRLIATVNDILDMRQIENKTLVLTKRVVPLSAVVRDGAEALLIQADAKRIAIAFDFPEKELFCQCDEQKIERVVLNIVGNAVKFTPPGGQIRVSIERSNACENGDSPSAIIAVCDTGMGIPADVLPKLTRRYFRVGDHVSGTGLGLAISREIVEIHGGRMSFASPVPGTTCGTAVYIALPIVDAPLVLAWSQEQSFLDFLQREIPLRGYTLLVASSAHDAIQRTGQLKASVLIVDARIADMDVRDLVMQLRENSAMQRLPVIVVGMTRLARSDVEFYRNFGIFYHSLPWGSNEIAHALAMAVRGKLR